MAPETEQRGCRQGAASPKASEDVIRETGLPLGGGAGGRPRRDGGGGTPMLSRRFRASRRRVFDGETSMVISIQSETTVEQIDDKPTARFVSFETFVARFCANCQRSRRSSWLTPGRGFLYLCDPANFLACSVTSS